MAGCHLIPFPPSVGDDPAVDALIAVGVFGEIFFTHKAGAAHKQLEIDARNKLADALSRAAKTEQELINLKTPRRAKFKGKVAALCEALKSFPNVEFDISMGQTTVKCKTSFGTLSSPTAVRRR